MPKYTVDVEVVQVWTVDIVASSSRAAEELAFGSFQGGSLITEWVDSTTVIETKDAESD